MKILFRYALAGLIAAGFVTELPAGGSGLNVVVVVNQNSTNSIELGNYYCEQRGVPPQNLLRIGWAINWPSNKVEWTRGEFETTLRVPLDAMLASRQLTNQIDYVLLSMDIPYRVMQTTGPTLTRGANSTTSALYYGFKADGCANNCPLNIPSCNLPDASSNSYAASEGIFRQTPPISVASNSWMVMMLTSSNLAEAKAVVDRGVASDATHPAQTVVLAKSLDRLRNVRFYHFDDALLNVQLRGGMNILRTNTSTPVGFGTLLGYQNGEQSFSLTSNQFTPGALADSLTSYGGTIFENTGHTDALDLLNSGATASYGTVYEPCNYFEKFASPQLYFYQLRGFSAAESYYLSVTNPYQGLLIGEPLSSPFASRSSGAWVSPGAGSVLGGTTNLSLALTAGDPSRPIQQVDLFLNGNFHRTLTNIEPRANNTVTVTLNGISTNYIVPSGSTIASIVSGLSARLNAADYSSVTKVRTFAHGDRIELQSLDLTRSGSNTTLSVSNSPGSSESSTTFLVASSSNFLGNVAYGLRSYIITNSAGSSVPVGAYLNLLMVKTNGTTATVSLTNNAPGRSLNDFARMLLEIVNESVFFQATDGMVAEDINMHDQWPYNQYVYGSNDFSGEFNFRALSAGWAESQPLVWLSGSPELQILSAATGQPTGTNRLDENVGDLRPRNHLYVTAGVSNLNVTFPFNTTMIADGYHELTAVAYEGSHVRTQTRISQNVRIQNNGWSATLTALLGGPNTALEATLQFAVAANTNGITRLELFSTGGLLATTNNVSSATFAVAATNLGTGLHPFYAMVTRSDGTQYRTETQWFRIIRSEPPFQVSIAGVPPTLSWPALAGRSYQVLSATEVTNTFTPRAVVIPTNSTGWLTETNNSSASRFYRVTTP